MMIPALSRGCLARDLRLLGYALRGLHWPASKDPSPYEIFNMTPASFDKSKVHETYFQLAKLYHPDLVSSSLSGITRAERFKMVVAAHEVLKDDSRRRLWDLEHTPYGRYTQSAPSSSGSSGYSYQHNYSYSAGRTRNQEGFDPYEDFWKEDSAKFNASLQSNRYFLLKVVVATVLFVGFVEVLALFEASDRRIEDLNKKSKEAEWMHRYALDNHNRGWGAEDRIQRFLEHRQRTLDKNPDLSYAAMTSDRRPRLAAPRNSQPPPPRNPEPSPRNPE